MAVIKTKDTIYAFGSRMKGWVKLKLKNADADFVVCQSSMWVTDGRQLFMIGADSDHWEGVDLDSGAVLLPPRD
jgi:ATP-dependent DNA ligase